MQKNIIDSFIKLSPNSQFFFATHSPIIASSFEPWEVVELKINKKTGKTERAEWFEGERHIDNYFKDARMLKWDKIFTEIYGLDTESNEAVRNKELSKVHRLKRQLEDLRKQNKTETPEYKKKETEFLKMSKKTGWDL